MSFFMSIFNCQFSIVNSNSPLFLRIARREFRSIATSYSVLLVLVGGVFAYGLLYNYMYAPNVVREVPIAVVDHSGSALSREYIRMLDATPEAHVAFRARDMLEARDLMSRALVYGILYLPRDFEERVLHGDKSVYPFYATTDAFLYYEALSRANLEVMEAMDGRYRLQLMEFLSLPGLASVATQRPVTVVGTALHNPLEGYGIYLIPSVLMLIIFQTLMLLVAMQSGADCRYHRLAPYVRLRVAPARLALSLVSGKTLTYTVLYLLFALFLVGLLPLLFDIPHGASWSVLSLLLVPYVVSTSLLGLALSRWYADAEAPVLLIAFFSIGLIFLSGVSYPLELMPWYWRVAHYLIPAPPAVLAYVALTGMDATPRDMWPQLLTLYVQVPVYLTLALWTYRDLLRAEQKDMLPPMPISVSVRAI